MSLKRIAQRQVNRLLRLVNAELASRADLEILRRELLRLVNAELASRADLEILRRELNTLRSRYGCLAPHPSPMPPPTHEAEAHLIPDNPRLRTLQDRYRRVTLPVVDHSRWTRDLVETDVDLRYFRGDNAYVYQYRDFNAASDYLLTAYYLRSIDRLGLFERLDEDELFGVYTFSFNGDRLISRDLLDSIAEIYFLEDTLGLSQRRDVTILDIGAGYGRLAYRLTTAFPAPLRVLCVDAIPESTFLSEFYLRFRAVDDRARVVPLDEIEQTLASQPIDLVTNIHSFSECTRATVCGWLDLIRTHSVPYVMIVPSAEDHGGTRLITTEQDQRRFDYLPELEARGYNLVTKRPKFLAPSVQKHGISPTYHHLFQLRP